MVRTSCVLLILLLSGCDSPKLEPWFPDSYGGIKPVNSDCRHGGIKRWSVVREIDSESRLENGYGFVKAMGMVQLNYYMVVQFRTGIKKIHPRDLEVVLDPHPIRS